MRNLFWFLVGFAFVALLMLLPYYAARAEEWDTTDKVLFGSFIALEVVDAAQTWEIHKHQDRYQEANPIFGRDPNMGLVIGVKGLAVGGVYWLAKDMTSADRKLLLGVLDVLQLSVVGHNYSLGLRFGF